MNETNFCYWLQGYFELNKSEELTVEQVKVIKEHLALVFNKVTTVSVTNLVDHGPDMLNMNTLKTPIITC